MIHLLPLTGAVALVAVAVTMSLASVVTQAYEPFYGPLFMEPHEGRRRQGEFIIALVKSGIAYLTGILTLTLTGGTFVYAYVVGGLAEQGITEGAIRRVLAEKDVLSTQVLLGGLFVGIVVVIIARLLTVSYSDFVVRYLVFQVLAFLNLFFLSIPIFAATGSGWRLLYKGLSDFLLRSQQFESNLGALIFGASCLTMLVGEGAVWLYSRSSSLQAGSYTLLDSVLRTHVEGEHALEAEKVQNLYRAAVMRSLSGTPDEPGEGLLSIEWLSCAGSPSIAQCIKTEVRALAAAQYGIPTRLVRDYDFLKETVVRSGNRLYENEINRVVERVADVLAHGPSHLATMDGRTLLDVKLEEQALLALRGKMRVIATEGAARRIESVLPGLRMRISEVAENRRFILLNKKRVVVSGAVPRPVRKATDYAATRAVLVDSSPSVVAEHANQFDRLWDEREFIRKTYKDAVLSIFSLNLGCADGERVLILVDDEKSYLCELARAARDWAKKKGYSAELVSFESTGESGREPPIEAWEAAFGRDGAREMRDSGLLVKMITKEELDETERGALATIVQNYLAEVPSAILSLPWFSLSHTYFRIALCKFGHTRFGSMPRLTLDTLDTWEGVDQEMLLRVEERTSRLASALTGAVRATLTTEDGTDLSFALTGKAPLQDTGILTSPGSFGNLPGGECYTAIVEGSAEGVLRARFAPNWRLEEPVEMTVRRGRVVGLSGDKQYLSHFEPRLWAHDKNAVVAELGIGTNDRVTDPINLRQAEKIAGTVHIGLGDNSAMGGTNRTPFHEDFVVFAPTLKVFDSSNKERLVVKQGQLTPE